MTSAAATIALAIESPIALRGGVNMIVETFIEALCPRFRIVLISMDADLSEVPEPIASRLVGHITWSYPHGSIEQGRRVADECARLEVKLVHFHGGTFGFGNRFYGHCPVRHLARRGIRSVWTNHTFVSLFDGMCGPKKPLWFKWAFLPFAWSSRLRELAAMETVITSSQLSLDRERHYYWPVREKFQLAYYSRLDEAVPLPQAPREPFILAVGHIAWRKGQLTLVRAFAQIAATHPAWRLVIIGPSVEADCFAAIEDLIRSSGLAGRIELLGGRNDAIEFMHTAGIFVQPSVWEGLPFALQEALFLGCPCLATRCDGNIELIDPGQNGLMVDPEQPEEMAAALDQLIRDEDLRARFAVAGRPSVLARGMTLQRMLDRHLAIYDAALLREKA